jgi:hypothetical protein
MMDEVTARREERHAIADELEKEARMCSFLGFNDMALALSCAGQRIRSGKRYGVPE